MFNSQLISLPDHPAVGDPRCTIEDLNGLGKANLRIGFDMTALYVTRAGIARYVRGLKNGLQSIDRNDAALLPLAWEVESFAYRQPLRALKTAYRELFWGRYLAPRLLRDNDVDLLHSTSSLFIRRPAGMKHVVTLHDMSISRHPERFRRWQIASWKRRLPVINDADRVICISQFTADEAMKLIGVPSSKIDVVHNGCDWHPSSILVSEAAPDFEVPGEFYLFVGSLEPGKNLKLLKEAYLHAAIKGRRLPPLLIVGARWEGVASEGEQPRDWHYLGYQSDEVLLYLYRRAVGLLFPSIYEGFGLPLVEAMAQGCPVICSPTSSLPEVAGDAALMVPLQPQRYVDAIRELMRKPAVRTELIARGRARAERFTWRRCAEETLDVYHNVAGL